MKHVTQPFFQARTALTPPATAFQGIQPFQAQPPADTVRFSGNPEEAMFDRAALKSLQQMAARLYDPEYTAAQQVEDSDQELFKLMLGLIPADTEAGRELLDDICADAPGLREGLAPYVHSKADTDRQALLGSIRQQAYQEKNSFILLAAALLGQLAEERGVFQTSP